MAKVLTPEEISIEIEKRKNIRREKLQKKLEEITGGEDWQDVVFVFSTLISKITK